MPLYFAQYKSRTELSVLSVEAPCLNDAIGELASWDIRDILWIGCDGQDVWTILDGPCEPRRATQWPRAMVSAYSPDHHATVTYWATTADDLYSFSKVMLPRLESDGDVWKVSDFRISCCVFSAYDALRHWEMKVG